MPERRRRCRPFRLAWVGRTYRADELNEAIQHLVAIGQLEASRSGHVRLTQAGYGPEPSQDEIERTILDAVGEYGVRPGDAIPIQAIVPRMMERHYRNTEIAAGLDALRARNLLKEREGTLFLTEAGFAEI